jgi:hypothetical protein
MGAREMKSTLEQMGQAQLAIEKKLASMPPPSERELITLTLKTSQEHELPFKCFEYLESYILRHYGENP